MIRSFRDKETEKVFLREFSRRLQSISAVAKRKLDQLNAAIAVSDLGAVPGNRLEVLAGIVWREAHKRLARHRTGRHSIRINDQWRICFRWVERDAVDVEILDYH